MATPPTHGFSVSYRGEPTSGSTAARVASASAFSRVVRIPWSITAPVRLIAWKNIWLPTISTIMNERSRSNAAAVDRVPERDGARGNLRLAPGGIEVADGVRQALAKRGVGIEALREVGEHRVRRIRRSVGLRILHPEVNTALTAVTSARLLPRHVRDIGFSHRGRPPADAGRRVLQGSCLPAEGCGCRAPRVFRVTYSTHLARLIEKCLTA